MKSTVKLAAPGKGLPFPENLIARFLFAPMTFRRLSVDRAIDLFIGEGNECLRLARTLSEDELTRPVLIKRFVGIEDNSRFWSVAMVIEHLHIVGQGMLGISTSLSNGIEPQREVKIEDVKPSQTCLPEQIQQYEQFLATYRQSTHELNYPELPTHRHPWFGALNAAQWLKLNGIHNRIHRKQIQAILHGLQE